MRRRAVVASEPLAGSESELRRMTAELEEVHHDLSLPALRRAVAGMTASLRDEGPASDGAHPPARGRTSRRTFPAGHRRRGRGRRPPGRLWLRVGQLVGGRVGAEGVEVPGGPDR